MIVTHENSEATEMEKKCVSITLRVNLPKKKESCIVTTLVVVSVVECLLCDV